MCDRISAKKSFPSGTKKTKQRIEVFNALNDAASPVTVQDLLSLLEKRGTPMWLSTIYRVLETFQASGIVQKVATTETGLAMYKLGDEHRHYAVCLGCKQIIELEGCPLTEFLPSLTEKKFSVVHHNLNISGYCEACNHAR